MYVKVKIVYNMAIVFRLYGRKNPVSRYRSFLNTLYYPIINLHYTQRSVSQENTFKKSKTVGSNNSFTPIENNFRVLYFIFYFSFFLR